MKTPKPLSPQKRRLLEASQKIHSQEAPELGFVCRTMVSASMPHARVGGLQYVRKTNKFMLTITGSEEGMIPYGSYPRLILSWVASEAVRTKSREILLGNSLSDFMHKVGLSVTGGKSGTVSRFKKQLKSLFSSRISFQYENDGEWFQLNMNIAETAHLFWEACPLHKIALFKSHIILGESFFNEIMEAPIPVDMRAIHALRDSALALDIYFWITYRLSYLQRSIQIPFEKLLLQFGVGYKDTPHGRYEFRRTFIMHLQKVLCLYPSMNVSVDDDGVRLSKSQQFLIK